MQFAQFFSEDLSLILDSGGTLEQGLESVLELTESTVDKAVTERLLASVRSGIQLNEAMYSEPLAFPKMAANLVRAGEESGQLSMSLKLVAKQLSKQTALQNKVTSALIYPLVLSVVLTLSILGLLIFIIPSFATLFIDNDLEPTLSMQALLTFSGFLIDYGPLVIVALTAIVMLARFRYGWKFRESLRRLISQTTWGSELIGLSEGAKFCQCMAGLLKGGIDQPNSLMLSADLFESKASKDKILRAAENVNVGMTLSESLKDANVLPPSITTSIGSAERAGKLSYSFDLLGERMETLFDRKVEMWTKVAEPVLVVLMGLVIGTVVYAVFGSMQSISGVSI